MSWFTLIHIAVYAAAKLFSFLRMHAIGARSSGRWDFVLTVHISGESVPTVKLIPLDPPTSEPTGDK